MSSNSADARREAARDVDFDRWADGKDRDYNDWAERHVMRAWPGTCRELAVQDIVAWSPRVHEWEF